MKKRGTAFQCSVCKRKFETVGAFKNHWDDDHDDEALGLKFMESVGQSRGIQNWTMRPVERELIIGHVKYDKNKRSLKQDYVANEILMREFEYGVEDRAMTIVEILGIPGAGKSVLALTLARHLQILWKQHLDDLWNTSPALFARVTGSYDEDGKPEYYIPRVRIGFNMQQTTEHVRLGRMGDIVIQDEDPALAGFEARSVQNQIQNLLKIMRKECINMIFVSPVQTAYIPVPTCVVEVLAKDTTRRLTAGALYDRQHTALGWVVLEILPEDDPLMVYYLKLKNANIKAIKEAGGRESAMLNEEALMRDAEKLYKFLLGMGFDPASERVSLEFLKGMALFAEIKGSTKYIEMVARFLQKALVSSSRIGVGANGTFLAQEPENIVTTDGEFIISLEEVINDVSWLETIYESTEEALEQKKLRGEKAPKKYQPKHAEAWYLIYVKGYTMQATADALAHYKDDGTLTDSAIANPYTQGGWRAIYQEEISGDAGEVALKNRMFPEGEWELLGGHGQPDIVNKEDNTWIEIKVRGRLKPKEPIESQVTNFEYDHVRAGNPLKVIRIGYSPERCRIEVWDVTLNPEWVKDAVEEEMTEIENEDIE